VATVQETISNGGKRPDARLFLNPDGSVRTQCRDTDRNGSFDARVQLGAGGVPSDALVDSNGDGKAEQRQVFEGGNLARVELDTNGNQRADVVQYYAGGAVARQCQDDDHDGTVDACFEGEKAVPVSGIRELGPAFDKLSCGSAHELWRRF
jgi:hypothetical protein